jgi:hypothetical protein
MFRKEALTGNELVSLEMCTASLFEEYVGFVEEKYSIPFCAPFQDIAEGLLQA